ncbi:MAG: hypothetical protein MUD01_00555, partial [Chloroflexaceae bacterium]|nr:hypothetical protein [Chloroflexaceae bacterium]
MTTSLDLAEERESTAVPDPVATSTTGTPLFTTLPEKSTDVADSGKADDETDDRVDELITSSPEGATDAPDTSRPAEVTGPSDGYTPVSSDVSDQTTVDASGDLELRVLDQRKKPKPATTEKIKGEHLTTLGSDVTESLTTIKDDEPQLTTSTQETASEEPTTLRPEPGTPL